MNKTQWAATIGQMEDASLVAVGPRLGEFLVKPLVVLPSGAESIRIAQAIVETMNG